MLEREWDAKNNGKLPHLFMSSKTATLVPEFAVEVLPWGRTAALVFFALKDFSLGRTLSDDDDDDILIYLNLIVKYTECKLNRSYNC